MGSKKHRKRDSSSSSSESNSSDSSNDSRKKRSRKRSPEESSSTKSKEPKTVSKGSSNDASRTKRSSSEEKSSSKHNERNQRRSRSRSNSYDRKAHRDRSRSREHSRRDADEDRVRSGGGSRGRRDYERDNRRYDYKDHRYDSREHKDDRKKDASRNSFRKDEGRYNRGTRDNRRRSRSKSFDHTNAKWGKNTDTEDKDGNKEGQNKEKPNFGLSGKLTEETNTYKGVVIKYSEPPEARKPRRRWRLYPFKGDKPLQTLYIHRESAYLIGRDRKVVDLPVDHPSCSKQHAALQYRLVPFTRDNGSAGKRVRPYLIDLESANGTFINNKKIEAKKYVELLEKDVIKFGFSSREYVLLHENSKDEGLDDDVKLEEEEIKEEVEIKEERT